MATGISGELVAQLQARALRLTRCREEAEDLLQDVLLIAWQCGRGEPAWLQSVMTRQAAFAVRGARRRRQRDALYGADLHGSQAWAACPSQTHGQAAGSARQTALAGLLAILPPSARRLLVLALHGLSAGEIQWLLRLRGPAFRQRLMVVRRGLAQLPADAREALRALSQGYEPLRAPVDGGVDEAAPGDGPRQGMQRGLLRRALVETARRLDGLGTHDSDGHRLLLRGH